MDEAHFVRDAVEGQIPTLWSTYTPILKDLEDTGSSVYISRKQKFPGTRLFGSSMRHPWLRSSVNVNIVVQVIHHGKEVIGKISDVMRQAGSSDHWKMGGGKSPLVARLLCHMQGSGKREDSIVECRKAFI